MAGANPTFPDNSLLGMLAVPWWTTSKGRALQRGRLVWAYLPHVEQEPRTLTIVGRTDDADHTRAEFRLEPLEASRAKTRRPGPPVAAMPLNRDEVYTVYRAKFRPCLVMNEPTPPVPRELRGDSKWQTAPTFLVAPYYGGDQDGTRAGFRPEFLDRARRGVYPQFLVDRLPIGGPVESVLRMDHIQPVGVHGNSHVVTEHQLSPEAMALLDDWLIWLTTGLVPEDSDLYSALQLLAAPPPKV